MRGRFCSPTAQLSVVKAGEHAVCVGQTFGRGRAVSRPNAQRSCRLPCGTGRRKRWSLPFHWPSLTVRTKLPSPKPPCGSRCTGTCCSARSAPRPPRTIPLRPVRDVRVVLGIAFGTDVLGDLGRVLAHQHVLDSAPRRAPCLASVLSRSVTSVGTVGLGSAAGGFRRRGAAPRPSVPATLPFSSTRMMSKDTSCIRTERGGIAPDGCA
jgi:hypothetical protein